ncbi:DinB family protein [Aureibaculum conchae]|uniref:DinB family protein n=1 Tax=Aureibaculum sp. 2308TA14-22 TaxID=3108392 RepID=UPI003394D082
MIETTNKLDELLIKTKEYISKSSDTELSLKANPEKWSKKEIIGHLIDSGINNIKRFTAVLIEKEPYRISPMKQVELVKVNDYQNSEIEELLALLFAINIRIKKLMLLQNTQTLATKIELYTEGNMSDLRYLMEDYVKHFEQHINQILKPIIE